MKNSHELRHDNGEEARSGATTRGDRMDSPAREKIRELSLALSLTDVEIILADLRDLRVQLELELQTVRDQRQAEHIQFKELIAEIKNELIRIQARFHIDAHLIGLIKAPQAGEKEWDGSKDQPSSQSSMLGQFVKSSH
jgi:hypothetical protein